MAVLCTCNTTNKNKFVNKILWLWVDMFTHYVANKCENDSNMVIIQSTP